MPVTRRFTLCKEERICSKLLIDQLFNGGNSHSMVAFPLRAVYVIKDRNEAQGAPPPQAKILISVPKKYFKRAVKRNRVKRQVREAYRKNKYILLDKLQPMPNQEVLLAFIWLDNMLHASAEIENKVCNLLQRIGEKIETDRKEAIQE